MGVNILEQRRRIMMAQPHEETQSGAVVTFKTYVPQTLPLTVQINPVQTGTGDPAPDNVRPITGWTSAKITRTGKNLLTGLDRALYESTGEKVDSTTRICCAEKMHVDAGERYNVSGTKTGTGTATLQVYIRFFGDLFSSQVSAVSWKSLPYTFTVPSDANYATVQFRLSTGATIDTSIIENAQVEKGETTTTFDPFGTVYNVTFPNNAGTVYGGTLTVNKDGTGQLVVDRKFYEYNGDENITFTENQGFFIRYAFGSSDNIDQDRFGIANQFKWVEKAALRNMSAGNMSFSTNASYRQFNIGTGTLFNSLTEVQTYLLQNPLQVCVYLSTPTTYTLSALQVISALKGINNLYADTGNLSVEYWTN